jgi:hypothetical protein
MRLLFGFILLSSVALGQDSLVRFRDLKYTTDFEKKAFRDWFKEKNNAALLDLLLSTSDNPLGVQGNAKERIDQITASLPRRRRRRNPRST